MNICFMAGPARTQNVFLYSRVTPGMYRCVLLCTINKSGGERATAGEQESNTPVAVYNGYSGEQKVV